MSVSLTEARQRIEHVVVLMLENRSFDHMLGHLGTAYDGIAEGDPRFTNRSNPSDPNSTVHRATFDAKSVLPVDPDHSHEGVLQQLETDVMGTANAGFVKNYRARCGDDRLAEAASSASPFDLGSLVMAAQPETNVPVLSRLAREFAVATRWFSAVPGETWPNRNFAHASTSDDAVNIEFGAYTDPTIFELLEQHGERPPGRRAWRIYHDGPTQVMAFRKLWSPGRIGNWDPIARFAEHVAKDDLASYSFIEPNHHTVGARLLNGNSTSQHPGNNAVGIADYVGADADQGADFR